MAGTGIQFTRAHPGPGRRKDHRHQRAPRTLRCSDGQHEPRADQQVVVHRTLHEEQVAHTDQHRPPKWRADSHPACQGECESQRHADPQQHLPQPVDPQRQRSEEEGHRLHQVAARVQHGQRDSLAVDAPGKEQRCVVVAAGLRPAQGERVGRDLREIPRQLKGNAQRDARERQPQQEGRAPAPIAQQQPAKDRQHPPADYSQAQRLKGYDGHAPWPGSAGWAGAGQRTPAAGGPADGPRRRSRASSRSNRPARPPRAHARIATSPRPISKLPRMADCHLMEVRSAPRRYARSMSATAFTRNSPAVMAVRLRASAPEAKEVPDASIDPRAARGGPVPVVMRSASRRDPWGAA